MKIQLIPILSFFIGIIVYIVTIYATYKEDKEIPENSGPDYMMAIFFYILSMVLSYLLLKNYIFRRRRDADSELLKKFKEAYNNEKKNIEDSTLYTDLCKLNEDFPICIPYKYKKGKTDVNNPFSTKSKLKN